MIEFFLADTFTVGQAINSLGFGGFQVKLSLVTGLCWMADSMEITILSILSPTLHCEWNITRYEQAFTTTVCNNKRILNYKINNFIIICRIFGKIDSLKLLIDYKSFNL